MNPSAANNSQPTVVQTEESLPTPSPTLAPDDTATRPPAATPTPSVADEEPPPGTRFQFDTDFSKHSVPYSEILSGGPPKDGIPAIDNPNFVSVAKADNWLEPQEPVAVFETEAETHIYPLQILMWHEIVNDQVGDIPVTMTFCPLCNTAIAFDRRVEGQVLDFGTTGRLRFSNLIMYDRQTESWWQQATGEAIIGKFTGTELTLLPALLISWEDARRAYPEAEVLSRDTGYSRAYGRNPYAGYDDINDSPYLYQGPELSDKLPPLARILKVERDGEAVAYPYSVLSEVHVANDQVAGQPIVVLWTPGKASALDTSRIPEGRDVGTALSFSREIDGQVLTFAWEDGRITDRETGTEWNGLGEAVAGPLEGQRLESVVGVNYFWFSWVVYRPDTRVYSP
jgi:hypothetical protein